MKRIFESGYFEEYAVRDLNSARKEIITESYQYAERKPTVFISHKHDDLSDLKGVIGFLEKEYRVKVYIDSRDPSMPKITSAKTGENIKSRIKECQKFILLATNGAIESKWCNWELGFGDANKYPDNIALFPIKPPNAGDSQYKGSEYMDLYPFIAYYGGTEKYRDGTSINKGYYVCTKKEGYNYIIPLTKWLTR
ncbi:MAG: toll/interleukin-1 receptor domain-containing protein [Oscillospiraceae bacterium]|nr:toll/interleukin-1 receptor domain-containing protein [Oscillospiraceae bacterium]